MAPDEQIENVRAQVASLVEARYAPVSATAARPYFADPPDNSVGWAELLVVQKIGVLDANVVWWGFSEPEVEYMTRAIAAGYHEWGRGVRESCYEPPIRAANDNHEEIER